MSTLEPLKKVPRVQIRCPLEIFARKNSRGWYYSCHHPPCPRFRYSDLVASNRSSPQPAEEQEQEQEQGQTEGAETNSLMLLPASKSEAWPAEARSAPSAPSECSHATSSVRYGLVVVVVVVVVGNFRSIRSLSSLMVEEEAPVFSRRTFFVTRYRLHFNGIHSRWWCGYETVRFTCSRVFKKRKGKKNISKAQLEELIKGSIWKE